MLHEIYVAEFGGHLFRTYFYRARGGGAWPPRPPGSATSNVRKRIVDDLQPNFFAVFGKRLNQSGFVKSLPKGASQLIILAIFSKNCIKLKLKLDQEEACIRSVPLG